MEAEIEQLKLLLKQVHNDSREIEQELEAELQAQQVANSQLQVQLDEARNETASWKLKFEQINNRIQAIEQQNDEFEQITRISTSTISRLETENHHLMEKLALARADTVHREELEAELQRLREKVNDTEEENIRLRKVDHTQHPAGSSSKESGINNDRQHPRRRSKPEPYISQVIKLRSQEWSLADVPTSQPNPVRPLVPPKSGKGHGTASK